jgi:hypothetical protein
MTIHKVKQEIRTVAGVHRCDADEMLAAVDDVLEFFDGDEYKAVFWFGTHNHQLGGKTPWEMIQMGRFQKLLSFIRTSLDDNNAPD